MGKILGIGKIRAKGEITLPKDVRTHLGVKPGDYILLITEHGQIVLKPADIEEKK